MNMCEAGRGRQRRPKCCISNDLQALTTPPSAKRAAGEPSARGINRDLQGRVTTKASAEDIARVPDCFLTLVLHRTLLPHAIFIRSFSGL
jgi:hypothetical protein